MYIRFEVKKQKNIKCFGIIPFFIHHLPIESKQQHKPAQQCKGSVKIKLSCCGFV